MPRGRAGERFGELLRKSVGGSIAPISMVLFLIGGRVDAATEVDALADEIFLNGFEQFALSINDYFGQCSVSVNGGAATSSPQPMLFPEGQIVSLHASANQGFVWRYWSGTDGGEPDLNADTMVAMVADRQVLACCQTADQTTCGPTLTVTKSGGGAGTVSSDLPGIDCGGDCSENFPANTQVVLTAIAAEGSTFAGWSGGGCSGTDPCTVTIDSVLTIIAAFDLVTPNLAFVTSTTFTGNLGGLAGADQACNTIANAAGHAGSYRAWLSTLAVNAKDRLTGTSGWSRTDGAPFADQVSDIASGHLFYPLDRDENGTFVGDVQVMTATNAAGNYSGSGDCSTWSSTANSTLFGIASSDAGGFTQRGAGLCSTPRHLYCFGIGTATVVAPPAVSARRAFVSTGWQPGGGIASADAHCQTDASAAGLSGTFKALLATSTASAISRFDTSIAAARWARPDDTVLAASAAALASATYLDAAPTSNAANTLWYSNYGVWSGAASLTATGTGTQTCNDWTAGSVAATGLYGLTDATKVADWRGYGSIACSQPNAIVCLQQ